ncbi:MFS transporter [Lentzea sp. NPDC058450]|uniref:MFS transporter n=1 Tax=Lentzea sp. NPDC058450 TaxID=3346505 RepID=UPI00364A963B
MTSVPEHDVAPDPRRWLALGMISLATLMVVLDASIINIALPQAQAALGISDANRHWAVTGYAATFGGLLLLGGRIADFGGRKRMLLIGLAGFAAASALGGLAVDEAVLVIARVLQGAFAAVLAPAALSLIAVTFTENRERARAFGVFAAVQGSGGAIGLLAGGLLTEYLDWRWCLLVNLPIAVVAIAGTWLSANESVASGPRSYDLPGALLATAGSVGLVLGFTLAAESGGWGSPAAIAALVTSVLLLAGFVLWQRRAAAPLLPLRVVLDRVRGGAFLTSTLVGSGMFGMFLFLTYYLQGDLGFDPLTTGLAFLPFCVGIVLVPLFVAPSLTRFGPRPPMVAGMAIAAAGMLLLTTLDGSPAQLGGTLVPQLVMGIGLGFVFTPMNSTALAGVDAADAGVASGLVNSTQQLGGALGVALLNTLYTSTRADAIKSNPGDVLTANLSGYHLAFAVSGVLFLLAMLCALLVMKKPRKPAPVAAAAVDATQ